MNGNNQIVKIDLQNQETVWTKSTGVAPYGITISQNNSDSYQIYVTNWGVTMPADSSQQETAGVPYGEAFVNPVNGAINNDTVSAKGKKVYPKNLAGEDDDD